MQDSGILRNAVACVIRTSQPRVIHARGADAVRYASRNNHVDPSVTDNRPINALVGTASILLFPYFTGAALLTNTTRTLLPWKTPPTLFWETIQIWGVGAVAVGILFAFSPSLTQSKPVKSVSQRNSV